MGALIARDWLSLRWDACHFGLCAVGARAVGPLAVFSLPSRAVRLKLGQINPCDSWHFPPTPCTDRLMGAHSSQRPLLAVVPDKPGSTQLPCLVLYYDGYQNKGLGGIIWWNKYG